MKKSKQSNQNQPTRPEDAFMVVGGGVKDSDAARQVQEIDAADDRKWLAEHPEAEMRRRMATSREEAAYGLPPGCTVLVRRGPMGSQIRSIHPPK